MLILQDITYIHTNRDRLFTDLNLVINKQNKVALIGNNGTGKSTLLQILAGSLPVARGVIKTSSKPYYVPQIFGQFNNYTIAQALQVANKLQALRQILDGNVTDEFLTTLGDDWAIEERCAEAFAHWQLDITDLDKKMETLSGGQKTKVFLAGISIHRPEIVLLDEPSNHLDTVSRNILYDYIKFTNNTLVVVSHDKALLNLLDTVYQLGNRGITVYGGNYDFYVAQKAIEGDALSHNLKSKEKALRKAKEIEKAASERQQKLDARGKKKQEKAGVPTIFMNTLRNSAEKSTAKMKDVHADKINGIAQELTQLRKDQPGRDKMKVDFDNSSLHKGKILVTAKDINFGYGEQLLWEKPLSFEISSGERRAIKGQNGSGKTTLIKMILGDLKPQQGTLYRADIKSIYIDQDYTLIDNKLTVYEQAEQYNSGTLQEHDIKIRLSRFLFTKEDWNKPCKALSGGEKMRLMLCALTISNQAPDMMILDEPTNNLDMQNVDILTEAINDYKGALLVVSHDEYFLNEVGVDKAISL